MYLEVGTLDAAGYTRHMGSRERLVEAMAELMWERGYSATSPREVRELSGVGQGSMYHYFPTKRDLGLAALNHNCQVQFSSWRTALADVEDPLEVLSAYLTLPRDPLKGCRVGRMAQDKAVMADDGLRKPIAEAFAQLHQMLVAVIDAAASEGRLPGGLDSGDLARTIVAVVQGGYVLAMAQQDRAPYDAARRGALELLRAAARAAPAGPAGPPDPAARVASLSEPEELSSPVPVDLGTGRHALSEGETS